MGAETEKSEKPTGVEKVGGIPVEDLQIYGIWAMDRSANVLLTDSTGQNIIRLAFEPDKNGSKLISASLEPGGKLLKVVALLEGQERTIIRPIAEMPKPDAEMMITAQRQALAEAEKKAGVPSRGPSEEDRKKYESLSDEAKEKFRNGMRERFSDEKFRNASEEDRRNTIRSLFDKIEKEDKKR